MSTEENKNLVRRFIAEVVNKNNVALVDEFFAPPLREGVKRTHVALHAGPHATWAGFHSTIEDMVAEGDEVVARFTFHGMHQGPWEGLPPTGKMATWPAVIIYRIMAGRIVDFWISQDNLSVMRQLGALPALSRLPRTRRHDLRA